MAILVLSDQATTIDRLNSALASKSGTCTSCTLSEIIGKSHDEGAVAIYIDLSHDEALQALRQLDADGTTNIIPVFTIFKPSLDHDDENVLVSLDNGAFQFLIEPFSTEEVVAFLDDAISRWDEWQRRKRVQ